MLMCEYILEGMALGGLPGHEAGRVLLRRMYRQHFGPVLPEICLDPGGKPRFLDSPVHFSISHTHRHVFCALSTAPIGVDAEETDRKVDLRLAEKILSPGELTRFRQSPTRENLLRFWVLKEALVKYRGTGLRGYPNFTDFSPEDPRIIKKDSCLVAVITKE